MNATIEIIKNKTAALIMLSAEIGFIMGKASDTQLQLIQRYSGYVGIAFQITDDILNLIADSKYGKEIGGDLREGKRTIIVSHFISLASAKDKRKFLRYFGKKSISDSGISEEISLLKKYGSIEYAKTLSDFYLRCGLFYLNFLPNNRSKFTLIRLSEFLTKRIW